MTKEILNLPAYEKWFFSRFTVATMENEMKWYSTEWNQNQEDYHIPDDMLKLAEKHGIKVRGHNVFWDDQNSQIKWVRPMGVDQLKAAMQKRLKSVVSRYAGKVIHWDVLNENLHFNFFETKLGPNASPMIYQQVGQIDHNAVLFMNEFNTLEQPMDPNGTPTNYIAKMKLIQATRQRRPQDGCRPREPFLHAQRPLCQGRPRHARAAQAAHVDDRGRRRQGPQPGSSTSSRCSGKAMATQGWKVSSCGPHGTPRMLFMCLTDNNFKNLPVGALVDKLIEEWKTHKTSATTDANGLVELDLAHGDYKLAVNHPSSLATSHTITVDTASSEQPSI
ncbi:Endo-1,4-beta-xylanase C [Hordeum vulgare]|nr:Endo-1,4-beta-xylanase C [Hordeum vulgare]